MFWACSPGLNRKETMTIKKRVLCAQRLRQVPPQFSWIDQRLVRQGKYLAGCSVRALALYLILVTVGDAEGLSYYSDRTLQRMLRFSADQLREARRELCRTQLIAYESPLYQVLSLEEPLSEESPRADQTRSVAQILHQIAGGGR